MKITNEEEEENRRGNQKHKWKERKNVRKENIHIHM